MENPLRASRFRDVVIQLPVPQTPQKLEHAKKIRLPRPIRPNQHIHPPQLKILNSPDPLKPPHRNRLNRILPHQPSTLLKTKNCPIKKFTIPDPTIANGVATNVGNPILPTSNFAANRFANIATVPVPN